MPSPWRGGAGVDAAIAIAGALLLWMALVPGSSVLETRLTVPVEVANLPQGSVLESVEPAQVEVTLRGLRRQLLLTDASDVSVRVEAYLARLGRRTFSLTPADVQTAGGLEVVPVDPETVRIPLQERAADDR